MILRDYQLEAVNCVAHELRQHPIVLIQAATGAGKSLIAAEVARRALEKHPSWRVLVLCYVREILESNHRACVALRLDSGIYCAGLKKKQTVNSVIHASRDSLGRNPLACGQFDLVIIDEAHMLSKDEDSRYQTILTTLAPRFIVGMTATPYRLGTGYIYGVRRMFPKLTFEISHKTLVDRGFLVPYNIAYVGESLFKASGVKLIKGEFDAKEVEAQLVGRAQCEAALMAWHKLAHDRKLTLFFCHSIDHASLMKTVCDQLLPGIKTGILDHHTKSNDRSAIIDDMRNGNMQAVFQVQTLTTGTDVPPIDTIVWFRPTMSTSLFVQGCGRGSRLSPGKTDCLVIDLVGNLERFGDIYNPVVAAPEKKKKKVDFSKEELLAMGIDPNEFKSSDQGVKHCAACHAAVHPAARKCDGCGYLFVNMRTMGKGEYAVQDASFIYHSTNANEPCMIITYKTKCGKEFKEWVMYQRSYAAQTARERRYMIKKNQVKYLLVKENPKNPRFPKLKPLTDSKSKGLSSHGFAPTESFAGATIPSESTTSAPIVIEE